MVASTWGDAGTVPLFSDVPAIHVSGMGFRSRPIYYGTLFDGLAGNWVDRTPAQQTRYDWEDAVQRIAKVRVAGSNPVVRSEEVAVQMVYIGLA